MIKLSPPSADFLALDILCFCLTLWLGTYLLKRNLQNMRLRLAGLSLISYSCAECCFVLAASASPFRPHIMQIGQWLLLLPSLLWTGTLIYSLPEDTRLRSLLIRCWYFAHWPLVVFCCIATLFLHSFLPLAAALFPLLIILGLTWRTLQANRMLLVTSLALIVTLTGSLIWFPYTAARLLVCCTLFVLGIAIVAQEAADQGEALLPDLFRSFDYALLTALVFGGQIALVMLLSTGITFPSLLLLQSTLATAIIIQVFSRAFVKLLDTIAFATFPQLMQARAELHTAIDVLPRLQQEVDLESLDEVEFTRLTRRALSQFGDLSRLATSPLTHLPMIKARLSARGIKDEDVLERAAELKKLLSESIHRLKPQGKGEFGTSDEWRYYNALYFPYVIGIKPYSRRSQHPLSDPVADEALNWFRIQIPERTLHNWQNTAAKLVAQDLRSHSSAEPASRSR
jgi:hypothetical protein